MLRCCLVAVACLVFGCFPSEGPPAPRVACDECGRVDVVPGEPLRISTGWSSTCRDVFDELVRGRSTSFDCHDQQFDVGVRCSTPCSLARDEHGELTVAAADVGAFSFEVELHRRRSGETFDYRSPVINVRMPNGVGLMCQETPQQAFEPCGLHVLGAKPGDVTIVAELGGRTRTLTRATINGRDVGPPKRGASFAWSELAPDEMAGGQLRPGLHHFSIVVGGKNGQVDVEVR